jgi:hypothetical protein
VTHPELAFTVEALEGRRPLAFRVHRIVCAGYTSRDHGEAERHIRELAGIGIARPRTVPVFFSVASYLATTDGRIEVQGPFTSGEAAFVLLFGPGGPWVTVGSDQTDRFLERHSVLAAKQVCPKVLGNTVWPVREVEGHWDKLTLRSWVRSGRRRRLYQDATLATILPLPDLIGGAERHAGRDLAGLVLLSGTVPTAAGQVIYGDAYELELGDPRLDRRIRAQYAVHVLEPSRR